jgi:hypothetical protein
MEKFARAGTGNAPWSALLDRKDAGISEQSIKYLFGVNADRADGSDQGKCRRVDSGFA